MYLSCLSELLGPLQHFISGLSTPLSQRDLTHLMMITRLHHLNHTLPQVHLVHLQHILYVLVCGKAPFDDQSMLSKIKCGDIEYPNSLNELVAGFSMKSFHIT